MESISDLDIIFKPFQFFGLQCFSVKSLDKGRKKQYPSIYYNLYILIWIIWVVSFVVLRNLTITSVAKSDFHAGVDFINYVNYVATIGISLILSVFKNSKLNQFFRHSLKISTLCSFEFDYKTNFSKLTRTLALPMLAVGIFLVAAFIKLIVVPSHNSGSIQDFVIPSFWWLFQAFVCMILLRFCVYVSVVNFHLKDLGNLISETFLFEQPFEWKKSTQVTKINANFYLERRQTIVLRRILMMIKEMASYVDDTMGLLVLLRLLMVITKMITFGFDFLRNNAKADDIQCKLL